MRAYTSHCLRIIITSIAYNTDDDATSLSSSSTSHKASSFTYAPILASFHHLSYTITSFIPPPTLYCSKSDAHIIIKPQLSATMAFSPGAEASLRQYLLLASLVAPQHS